ncbi:MAG TPA: glycosyltransferase [Beijerinckiaceae bacterium]|nr:glycosyltransferase [Beijerinckiaceae bacterium]
MVNEANTGRKPHHALIVIMPNYEDRASATHLLRDLARECAVAPYVVAIDDGSTRDPLGCEAIQAAGLAGEVVYLRRNMGHQRAIAVGIVYVAANFSADAVIVMDSDGEDQPHSIDPLLTTLNEGRYDIVVAERRRRSEPWSFRTFYFVYRQLFRLLTGRSIRFGNFSALSMRAVARLAAMQETWVHVAAAVMVSRLRIGSVATDRGTRYEGRSRMNFTSLALHGLRSIIVFAEDVLVRVGISCILLSALALGSLVATVVLKTIGFATPGWFSIAVGVLVLIVMQAGILTFVTLMVSGFIRNAPPASQATLDQLIERVDRA